MDSILYEIHWQEYIFYLYIYNIKENILLELNHFPVL